MASALVISRIAVSKSIMVPSSLCMAFSSLYLIDRWGLVRSSAGRTNVRSETLESMISWRSHPTYSGHASYGLTAAVFKSEMASRQERVGMYLAVTRRMTSSSVGFPLKSDL